MNSTGKIDLTSVKEGLLFPAHRTANYLRYLAAKQHKALEDDVIVSLTTYPDRFHSCIHTIRSMLRQTCRPFRIELYVSREETVIHPLPRALTEMTDEGLHIEFITRNIGSYKKLVPALERWPDKTIVTADDDKLYPPTWLAGLVGKHREMPDVILCHRARLMSGRSDNWKPYSDWTDCRSTVPDVAVFPIGVGGVLYPPNCLHPEVIDIDTALALAPTSDDIWFKIMAWRNRTLQCQIGTKPKKYGSIPNLSNRALYKKNVILGGNDAALASLANLFGFVPGAVLDRRRDSVVPDLISEARSPSIT